MNAWFESCEVLGQNSQGNNSKKRPDVVMEEQKDQYVEWETRRNEEERRRDT
jgi:hypothetical protein